MYGKKCIGFNNQDIPDFIKLEVKDGILYKKNKQLDEYSFLDIRIKEAWNYLNILQNKNCILFVDSNLNIYSPNNNECKQLPGTIFKFNKKKIQQFDKIFILDDLKFYNKETTIKNKSKDLNRILVNSFLTDIQNITENVIENIGKKARSLDNELLELFKYNTKSFLDIKIFNDLAIQFDLERYEELKHFVHHCINISKNKYIKNEIRLHYLPSSKGFQYFDQRMYSGNNTTKTITN